MSDPVSERDPGELAAEYALGLLQGDELAQARALLRADAQFAREVGLWLGHYAGLLHEVQPADPPARVWSSVEQRIAVREGANDNENRKLRGQVRAWRTAAVGITAVAASLAAVLVVRPNPNVAPPIERPAPAAPPMVAMLGQEERQPTLMASWDPGSRNLVVGAASTLAAAPNHSHELWVIPADGKPRSLGTMPDGPRMHARIDESLAAQLHQGATLAVSVEPRGGSPTGTPTGPVVLSGKLETA